MIDLDVTDGIACMRLAHGKANAFDVDLLDLLTEALERLAADPATRALVITGNGRLFSAGVDLFQVTRGGEDYVRRFLPVLTTALERLFLFPRPVVAAIDGHAIAGGLIVAMAADRVLMADGAGTVGLTELRVGVPFPGIALEIVRHRLGAVSTAALVFEARNVDARAARDRGLVDALLDADALLAGADSAARELAALPADAFALTKRQLRRETLERARTSDDAAVLEVWASAAGRARIEAFLAHTVARREARS